MHRRIFAAAVVLGLAIGFVPTTAPVLGSVGAKVYWTDRNNGATAAASVSRSNLDGSGVESLVPPGSNPRFIALDPANAHAYWTDTGVIRRADLDGAGVQDVISGLPGPMGIALDVAAQQLYWGDTSSGGIHRANLDGTGVTTIFVALPGRPRALAIDADARKIYWTETGTRRIRRANLDGSGVEDVVPAAGLLLEGIALDPAGGNVYWADVSFDVSGVVVSRVRRANLDGSNVEDIVVIPAVSGIPASPTGVAVDAGGGKVYWTVYWAGTTEGKIQRANLDGTAVEDIVTGLDTPWGVALLFSVQFVRPVGIDIKPGDAANNINPASHGVIRVAILSAAGFVASEQVDPASLTFGRTGTEQSLAFCSTASESVNADDLLDLVCHFYTDIAGFQPGDTQGVLKGQTFGGESIEGTDQVRLVP